MNWILSLSTRTKLTFGIGFVLMFLLVNQGVYYFELEDTYALERSLFDHHFPEVVSLHRLESSLSALRASTLELLQMNGAERDSNRAVEDVITNINTQLVRINHYGGSDQDMIFRIHDLNSAIANHINTLKNEVLPLIGKRDFDGAGDVIYGALATQHAEIGREIAALEESSSRTARHFVDASRKRVSAMEWTALGLGGLAVLIALGLIGFMDKYVACPLKNVAQLADRVARGDLTIKLPVTKRNDEVGRLVNNFTRMIDSLNDAARFARGIAGRNLTVMLEPKSDKDILVFALNDMVSNLRSMTLEISEAAAMLAASSGQMLAGTSQLASRSSQTATAVSQTKTTVEEVRQTSAITNTRARHVAESSQHAVEVSIDGRRFMDDTIEGINKIGSQMDVIAESIITLSQQSRAIAEIISAVNDLAEQTNLLAVNASIEAARAGEQGKGFVVVAQEIKNLADQSKQATMQVRTILSDIQGAIGAAVMATEQGGKTVETGLSQSALAQQTIQTLATSIDHAAQAAIQIAASSREQSIGLDQVAVAMNSIQDASAQNVATNKELETSSHGLQQMGQKLNELVATYKTQ